MKAPAPGARLRVDVLQALMAERDWNKAALARQTGIPESSVGRLLDGKMQPTGRTIAQLMRAFPRLEVEDLFDLGRDRPATETRGIPA